MSDFEETVIRKLCAIADAVNWGDQQAVEILKHLRPGMRLAIGLIVNQQSGRLISMSQSTTINITNVANPAAATFYRGIIDVAGGTAAPVLAATAGGSLIAIVGPNPINSSNQFLFNVYPIDANPETNDTATVTATLPDGDVLTFNFSISGSGETESVDPSSSVASWTGAPAVPTTAQ